MKCEEIRALLDQLMDGELTDEQEHALEEHGRDCPACAAQIRSALQMKALFDEMPPEVDVPLATQAAWREAVRAEARKKKAKRFYSWASVAAAAVVLVVGVSMALNGRDAPQVRGESAPMMIAESPLQSEDDVGEAFGEDFATAQSAGALKMSGSDFGPIAVEAADVARVESDGNVAASGTDGAADMAVEAEYEAAADIGAPMHELCLQVEDITAACDFIGDLVSEYEGTADVQRMDGAANLYIELPSESVVEFISAVAHLDHSGQALEVPEISGETASSLLLVLTKL